MNFNKVYFRFFLYNKFSNISESDSIKWKTEVLKYSFLSYVEFRLLVIFMSWSKKEIFDDEVKENVAHCV